MQNSRALSAATLLFALTGCAGAFQPSDTYIDSFGNEVFSADALARKAAAVERKEKTAKLHAPVLQRLGPQVVTELCRGRVSAPGSEVGLLHGAKVVHQCGTLYQAFGDATPKAQVARLVERYSLASATWIANHCEGYAAECANGAKLEALFRRSHNDVLGETIQGELARVDAEQARLEVAEAERDAERSRAQWRAIGNSVQQVGQAMQENAQRQQQTTSECEVGPTVGRSTTVSCRNRGW